MKSSIHFISFIVVTLLNFSHARNEYSTNFFKYDIEYPNKVEKSLIHCVNDTELHNIKIHTQLDENCINFNIPKTWTLINFNKELNITEMNLINLIKKYMKIWFNNKINFVNHQQDINTLILDFSHYSIRNHHTAEINCDNKINFNHNILYHFSQNQHLMNKDEYLCSLNFITTLKQVLYDYFEYENRNIVNINNHYYFEYNINKEKVFNPKVFYKFNERKISHVSTNYNLSKIEIYKIENFLMLDKKINLKYNKENKIQNQIQNIINIFDYIKIKLLKNKHFKSDYIFEIDNEVK